MLFLLLNSIPWYVYTIINELIYLFIYFKDFIYLFLERGEGREKERERNIDVREKH